jgi:hypothetical protein
MVAKQLNQGEAAAEAASDNQVGARRGIHTAKVLNSD